MAKSIHVSMPEFRIVVREDGADIRIIDHCGFGREEGDNNLTPPIHNGSLSLTRREICHLSHGDPDSPMPYSLFFEGEHDGCAFHWGSIFAESHGCIHLDKADAKWLFEWAGRGADADPVALEIVGPQPLPGVRVYRFGSTTMLPSMVLTINNLLAAEGRLHRAPDENYDEETAEAVRDYQVAHDLEPYDGWVGPLTAAKMGIAPLPHCPD